MANDVLNPKWADLLEQAVANPGKLMEAYSAFHRYSLGNMIAAMSQCLAREIPLGPIATFKAWQDKKRWVRKGEKAIMLCMPVTCRGERKDKQTGEIEEYPFTRFVWRKNWFVLSQTDGETSSFDLPPTWNRERALERLEIESVAFEAFDGNVQGYARGRKVAVSPLAQMPEKTLFHEMAHVVLGHTTEAMLSDDERTPRNIREVEAESVAMLLCASLSLPGVEYCRGYIQNWYNDGAIPEKSAQRIFAAADKILKAGQTS